MKSLLGKIFGCAALLAVWAGPASATDDTLVRMQSGRSVTETIDRLAAIVEKKGATIFARVDHAKGAEGVGMALRPAQLLIFGNPKLGTPIMQGAQLAGLDLPMKMLAYEDESGHVWLAYRRIEAVADMHGIEGHDDAEAAVAKALNGLATAATGEN